MKGYRLTPGGGIEGLQRVELPEPTPQADEIVVRVRATSLNYRDLMLAKNNAAPIVPLSDGAGEVVAVGDLVTRFAVGDRVASCFFRNWIDGSPSVDGIRIALGGGSTDGMLAEQVTLRADAAVALPAFLSLEEGATLPCAAVTAWNGLFEQGSFRPGQGALFLGTGGVSIFGLQFAHAAGFETVITSSSNDKLAKATALGATHVINYREREDWGLGVREATEGRGVDNVLDVGGENTWTQAMQAVRTGGHVALIGAVSGGTTPGGTPPLGRAMGASRITVGSRRMFEDMLRSMTVSDIHPVIDRVFGFDEAAEAYRYLEGQGHFGKVVIQV
jgi:NADPH:quinone reductase-like Zn-dependent oxidoreductase